MDRGLPEQIVAIFADAVQPGEDTFVVHPLALYVEEGPLGEVVAEQRRPVSRVTGSYVKDQR